MIKMQNRRYLNLLLVPAMILAEVGLEATVSRAFADKKHSIVQQQPDPNQATYPSPASAPSYPSPVQQPAAADPNSAGAQQGQQQATGYQINIPQDKFDISKIYFGQINPGVQAAFMDVGYVDIQKIFEETPECEELRKLKGDLYARRSILQAEGGVNSAKSITQYGSTRCEQGISSLIVDISYKPVIESLTNVPIRDMTPEIVEFYKQIEPRKR